MALIQRDSQMSVLSDEESSSGPIGEGHTIDKSKLENSTIYQGCQEVHIIKHEHIYNSSTIIYQQDKSGNFNIEDKHLEKREDCSEQSNVSEATSSKRDMEINQEKKEERSQQPSASGITATMRDMEIKEDISINSSEIESTAMKLRKKSTLRQAFTMIDGNTVEKYQALVAENKFVEALEVMRKLPVSGAAYRGEILVDFHKRILRSDENSDRAHEARQDLLSLIKENVETTPQEIKEFADELREKLKHFDSILFYYLSGGLYRDATKPNLAVDQIERCAYGMLQSIVAMLEADESLKSMVKHHVIPLITELKTMILTIDGASEQARCLQSSWCDHHKEYCEHLVGDYEAAEQTILDAVKSMQDCFGEKAKEYQVFGHLHNNLGHTYGLTSRYREAAEYYELAINSLKLATDYQSSDEKTQDIKRSEDNLRIVNKKLNK